MNKANQRDSIASFKSWNSIYNFFSGQEDADRSADISIQAPHDERSMMALPKISPLKRLFFNDDTSVDSIHFGVWSNVSGPINLLSLSNQNRSDTRQDDTLIKISQSGVNSKDDQSIWTQNQLIDSIKIVQLPNNKSVDGYRVLLCCNFYVASSEVNEYDDYSLFNDHSRIPQSLIFHISSKTDFQSCSQYIEAIKGRLEYVVLRISRLQSVCPIVYSQSESKYFVQEQFIEVLSKFIYFEIDFIKVSKEFNQSDLLEESYLSTKYFGSINQVFLCQCITLVLQQDYPIIVYGSDKDQLQIMTKTLAIFTQRSFSLNVRSEYSHSYFIQALFRSDYFKLQDFLSIVIDIDGQQIFVPDTQKTYLELMAAQCDSELCCKFGIACADNDIKLQKYQDLSSIMVINMISQLHHYQNNQKLKLIGHFKWRIKNGQSLINSYLCSLSQKIQDVKDNMKLFNVSQSNSRSSSPAARDDQRAGRSFSRHQLPQFFNNLMGNSQNQQPSIIQVIANMKSLVFNSQEIKMNKIRHIEIGSQQRKDTPFNFKDGLSGRSSRSSFNMKVSNKNSPIGKHDTSVQECVMNQIIHSSLKDPDLSILLKYKT